MKTKENTQDSKAKIPEDLLYCNYAATVLLTIFHITEPYVLQTK